MISHSTAPPFQVHESHKCTQNKRNHSINDDTEILMFHPIGQFKAEMHWRFRDLVNQLYSSVILIFDQDHIIISIRNDVHLPSGSRLQALDNTYTWIIEASYRE